MSKNPHLNNAEELLAVLSDRMDAAPDQVSDRDKDMYLRLAGQQTQMAIAFELQTANLIARSIGESNNAFSSSSIQEIWGRL